jgi:hypothetical protein
MRVDGYVRKSVLALTGAMVFTLTLVGCGQAKKENAPAAGAPPAPPPAGEMKPDAGPGTAAEPAKPAKPAK